MTHPFHPLVGREFVLVNYTVCWGEPRAYYYDEADRLKSLPARWTSAGSVDPFVELSAGRSLFRVRDLLELAAFLDEFRSKV